jgi:hypothetical protein
VDFQNQSVGRMDVTSALGPAFNRAIQMLFKPFDFLRWLVFGLIILLETCGEGGGNFSNPFSGRSGPGGSGGPSTQEIVDDVNAAIQWVRDNYELVLGIGVPAALLVLLLAILVAWLKARGQMMFIRAVATNDTTLRTNWEETAGSSSSLLKYLLALTAIEMVVGWTAIIWVAIIVWRLLQAGSTDIAAYALQTLPIIGVAVVVFVLLGIFASLQRNFVAPIMFRHGLTCTEAWRRFGSIGKANVGPILVFFVLRFLIGIAGGVLAVVVTLLTCCIGGLPYVHQVIMSPYYVFDRAWSLYALGSLGPDYQMVEEPAPASEPWGNPSV